MALARFVNHTLLWGRAFGFGKVHDVLEAAAAAQLRIGGVICSVLLLGYCLLELELLLLGCQHLLLLVSQYRMFRSLASTLGLLLCLSWAHYCPHKLAIVPSKTHTCTFLVLRWRALD